MQKDKRRPMRFVMKSSCLYPCRALYQYLIPEKGFEEHDADVIINSKAIRVLTSNRELSKLSPASLYDAINS